MSSEIPALCSCALSSDLVASPVSLEESGAEVLVPDHHTSVRRQRTVGAWEEDKINLQECTSSGRTPGASGKG